MKPRGAALALVLLSARALADGPSIFEKAATFEPTIHFAKIGAIEIEPLLQARWTGTETSGASEAQSNAIGLSLHRAIRISDSNVVDRLSAGAEQTVSETKLADQVHLLFEVWRGSKCHRRLRREE